MGVFDQAARFAAKLDPPGFYRWALPGTEPSLHFAEWLDTRTLAFPGGADATGDLMGIFDPADPAEPPWAVVTEFQAEPDADILQRTLDYAVRLRRERRPGRGKFRVAALVLNLTGPPQPPELQMFLPTAETVGLRFAVAVRTLRDHDAAATLDRIADGRPALSILPWVPLMRGAEREDVIARRRVAAEAEPDRRRRGEPAGPACVFAELAKRLVRRHRGLEGWNMLESTIVNEWQTMAVVKNQRNVLRRTIEVRFGPRAAAEFDASLIACDDLERLTRWFDVALTAGDVAELRKAIAAG
jgi:hypothetical protein